MMCNDVRLNNTFVHAYSCDLLSELSGGAQERFYFPGASLEKGRDGLMVEVKPQDGKAWIGVFGFGMLGAKGVSGMFTMPNPRQLCVVARGNGYLVNVDAPTDWEAIRATPVLDVRPIRERLLIVFAEHTRLVAYGEHGFEWKTKRLTWDGLKITDVTDSFITGEFWDLQTESLSSFVVDLATGTHEGGIGLFIE